MMEYIKTFYNFIKIYFYNFLNVSGIEHKDSIKWVYYTYLGKRYRFPIKKGPRGPSMRDFQLELFFEDKPEFEEELRGPFGDYHGVLPIIKKHYNLTSSARPMPFKILSNLLFIDSSTKRKEYFTELIESQEFKEIFVNFMIDFTSITKQGYELMLDEDKQRCIRTFDQQLNFKYDLQYIKDWLEKVKNSGSDLLKVVGEENPFALMILEGYLKKLE